MFLNVWLYSGGKLVQEINPYDPRVSTLKGLQHAASPSSPALLPTELYDDDLVYEAKQTSSLTGEAETLHLALATKREKDNRIPPHGFRIAEAAARLADPVMGGASDPGYFTAAEYAGGYRDVSIAAITGADTVTVGLYYQTTSREYVEFLRSEIAGTKPTLSSPTPSGEANAYVMKSDPFFAALVGWGETLWQLWDHNRAVPGAAPILMASASLGTVTDPCLAPASDGQACDDGDLCTSGDACTGGFCGGSSSTTCSALDECHVAGACAPTTGQCSQPSKADGTACSLGVCTAGVCAPVPDAGEVADSGKGADAGAPADGGRAVDAARDAASEGAADAAKHDGGRSSDAGSRDAAPPGHDGAADAGTRSPGATSCGCRTAAAPAGATSLGWLIGALSLLAGRAAGSRRRRRRQGAS